MKHYFYTKWTFTSVPDGLDSVGPFHSTWITESSFGEMLDDTVHHGLKEFFIKEFETKEEMNEYAKTVGLK